MRTLIVLVGVAILGAGAWFLLAPVRLEVLSPNGGEVWSKGQKVQITWSAPKTVTVVNIRLAIAGGEEGQSFNAAIASDVPNTGSYEWTVQELYAEVWGRKVLPVPGEYRVTVEDAVHNAIYDMSDAPFSIK